MLPREREVEIPERYTAPNPPEKGLYDHQVIFYCSAGSPLAATRNWQSEAVQFPIETPIVWSNELQMLHAETCSGSVHHLNYEVQVVKSRDNLER